MSSVADVTIRAAVESDLPGLEWDGQYAHYRRLYRHAMNEAKRGRRLLLVAELAGYLVGQIFIQFNSGRSELADGKRSGYLYSFRVRPEYRNQGIGSDLLRKAEAVLMSRAFERAVIAVARDNEGAQRLYDEHGYQWFAADSGEWSYVDQNGDLRSVREPAYLYHKDLNTSG